MAVYQAGDANPDGTTLGRSTATKVSLYGVTPVVQPASASQATIATIATNATVAATDFNANVNLTNALRAALVSLGAIKGSA